MEEKPEEKTGTTKIIENSAEPIQVISEPISKTHYDISEEKIEKLHEICVSNNVIRSDTDKDVTVKDGGSINVIRSNTDKDVAVKDGGSINVIRSNTDKDVAVKDVTVKDVTVKKVTGKGVADKGAKEKISEKVLEVEPKIKESKAEEDLDKSNIKPEEATEANPKTETVEKELGKGRISDSLPCCISKPRQKIIRNQSDIFSLQDAPTTLQTSIFSVNGSPSRRVFRKQEPAGHVFQRSEDSDVKSALKSRITRENYNDEKRPSSSYRNPLTGTGLSSNDEYKSKGLKRKDGNPLLGLGYDAELPTINSQHRIPPGGHSHKLW